MLVIISLIVFALIASFLLYWKFVFLRDPARQIPADLNSIVSPADGKVIDVLRWDKAKVKVHKNFFGAVSLLCSDVASSCYLISIFMSPLDVHVNRIPVDGKVLSIRHRKGSFRAANSMIALQNEKNEVLLGTSFGKLKIVQIAGFLARRIECWIAKNQNVIKGQRLGRINLGSQVVLVLPSSLKIKVSKGQRLKAGETVVATR